MLARLHQERISRLVVLVCELGAFKATVIVHIIYHCQHAPSAAKVLHRPVGVLDQNACTCLSMLLEVRLEPRFVARRPADAHTRTLPRRGSSLFSHGFVPHGSRSVAELAKEMDGEEQKPHGADREGTHVRHGASFGSTSWARTCDSRVCCNMLAGSLARMMVDARADCAMNTMCEPAAHRCRASTAFASKLIASAPWQRAAW